MHSYSFSHTGSSKARLLLRTLNNLFPPPSSSSAEALEGERGKRDKANEGGGAGAEGKGDALDVVLRWIEGSDDVIDWVADPRVSGKRKPAHCGQCGQVWVYLCGCMCMYVYLSVNLPKSVCIHVYVCVSICAVVQVNVYLCVSLCIFVYLFVNLSKGVYICVCMCMCVCVCTCI